MPLQKRAKVESREDSSDENNDTGDDDDSRSVLPLGEADGTKAFFFFFFFTVVERKKSHGCFTAGHVVFPENFAPAIKFLLESKEFISADVLPLEESDANRLKATLFSLGLLELAGE